jgi:anaerobic ribonucleoside-triphosphate reductase activating protein
VRGFKKVYPNKTVWLWTGYLWEDVADDLINSGVDVIVDGQFKEELKDLRLKYRGSSNQRIIDVPASARDLIIMKE